MKTREMLASEYRVSREWPTKSEWLEKYRDGLMAYEIGYEVEEAFEAGHSARDSEISALKDELRAARLNLTIYCQHSIGCGYAADSEMHDCTCDLSEAIKRIDEVLG